MSEQQPEAALDIQDTASRFVTTLQPYAPAILSGLQFITKATQAFSDFFAREIAPHLETLARIDWAEITRRLNELPAKSKAAMVLASSKGWFFGWDQSLEDVLVLVEKMAQIDPSEVDELLSQYYRDNLQSMAHSLTTQYSARAAAINAAVKAHSELGGEGYYLSVPVFIAQADGLLTDITGVKSALMQSRKSTYSPEELQASEALRLRLQTDPESLALVTQFLNLHEHDLMKSAAKRVKVAEVIGHAFTALNRHQVMHGESSDYGTEMNSLKAFSLLAAVGLHLPLVLDRADRSIKPEMG
ncbi:MAG: hypothetical protein JWQ10_1999 [Herbaspirillum sp.]|nr:hypothetical protein [Herbaspirillum sp.]